ncbi:MAG: hypothetical protein ACR2IJ_08090 [Fluviibacter sp.]
MKLLPPSPTSPLANAEFALQFTTTNLRHMLGAEPPDDVAIARCRHWIRLRERQIDYLKASKTFLVNYFSTANPPPSVFNPRTWNNSACVTVQAHTDEQAVQRVRKRVPGFVLHPEGVRQR